MSNFNSENNKTYFDFMVWFSLFFWIMTFCSHYFLMQNFCTFKIFLKIFNYFLFFFVWLSVALSVVLQVQKCRKKILSFIGLDVSPMKKERQSRRENLKNSAWFHEKQPLKCLVKVWIVIKMYIVCFNLGSLLSPYWVWSFVLPPKSGFRHSLINRALIIL